MRYSSCLPCLTAALLWAPPPVSPLQGNDSVSVVPGARYEASGLRSALTGAGYRELWTTAVRVPVADLSTLGGGLTPFRLGGGMTTQTLHLRGEDGRRYVMRSVDKTPGQGLESRLQGTIVEKLLQDQISAQCPTGAPVVSRLLDAVGVLHAVPQLMAVPDDPRLGEFRELFAGMLVLFEERPDDGPSGAPGFAGSRKIVDTEELLKRLEDSSKNRIAAVDFLRGRLVDLLVGDRDRSVNNFLWARFDGVDGTHMWRPIPRDRDQAFVEFDGVLKSIGRVRDPRLITFDEEYPSIVGLTRNAWDMDRTLLVSLTRTEWDAAVRSVQAVLTDEVIDDAARAMPPEHFALIGEEMIRKLRSRRDLLPTAADELYEIVFQVADIHATDKKDVARIERFVDGSVNVELYRKRDGERYFAREFVPSETDEVRLYLHGGADVADVIGRADESIMIHVIGGKGRDRLTDSSVADGVATVFHDRGEATSFATGPSTAVIREHVKRPRLWRDVQRDLDFGSHTVPRPTLGYDRDFGLIFGGGFTRYTYGIGAALDSKTTVQAAWAVGTETSVLKLEHFRRLPTSGIALSLRGRYSGIDVLNFFGYGNETQVEGSPSDYRIHEKKLEIGTSAHIGGELRFLRFGPVLRATWSDELNPMNIPDDRIGAGTFRRLGLEAAFLLDARDLPANATSGFMFSGAGAWVPIVFEGAGASYGLVHGQGSTYLSPFGGTTLALRVGGHRILGDAPHSESAFIGGQNSVRGLPRQRYAGRSSVFANAELRQSMGVVFLLVPSEWGVFAFGDTGRVYADDEISDIWHRSWGGGFWIAPVRREMTFRFTLALAEGQTALYTGLGLTF